jgi:uncharacterized membrane protein
MPLLSFCEWVQNTEFSVAVREGALLYPIIGGFHLLAIALFGGMLLAVDLRLLGWALQSRPVSDVVGPLRVWKWVGGAVVTVSGLMLAWCEPVKLYHSKSFWIKMALFLLVAVHALIFRRGVYGNTTKLDAAPAMPAEAKLAAALSLILWAGMVFAGRLIAFDS